MHLPHAMSHRSVSMDAIPTDTDASYFKRKNNLYPLDLIMKCDDFMTFDPGLFPEIMLVIEKDIFYST